jgi:glycosyltransferase involved in cell wall biosynthesis
MNGISATVITKNEEANIERCLLSLDFADEIVVVDSESTDRTVEMARKHTSRVLVNKWPGHIQQKNYAIEQTSNQWVLSLDADEEITPGLRQEILELRSRSFDGRDGFYLPRRSIFMGRWIQHCGWYPDYHLRLFDKSKGRFGGVNPHDKVVLKGRTACFKNPIKHYTYPSLDYYMKRFNSYTSIAAAELGNRGKRFSLLKMIFSPPAAFIKMYFLKAGFLDGVEGLVLCTLSAYYVLLKNLKLWESQQLGA